MLRGNRPRDGVQEDALSPWARQVIGPVTSPPSVESADATGPSATVGPVETMVPRAVLGPQGIQASQGHPSRSTPDPGTSHRDPSKEGYLVITLDRPPLPEGSVSRGRMAWRR